jgi:signal peptidase II
VDEQVDLDEPGQGEDAGGAGEDEDAVEPGNAADGRTGRTRPSARRWILFGALAAAIVVGDQLLKAWIVGNLAEGEGLVILGDWLRIVHWRNTGILFGMLPRSGGAFAIVSLVVAGLIVVYHAKAGRGLLVTLALGLLLGGAIGNLFDRVRYGNVIDFVDMGIGAWRFYTYNLADAAISTSIVLLVLMSVFPRLGDGAPDDRAA